MNVADKVSIAKPYITDEEVQLVTQVLISGQLAQGEMVADFENRFAAYIGSEFAVALNSGTSGLHLALLALGVGEGDEDEVITTTFSFMGTASAILMANATPVFVDIDPQTYNIDVHSVERAVTRKTRAIIPVHLYGQPCDMDQLLALSQQTGIPIVEDACQAHGAAYKGLSAGAMGTLGVFSFYATKNMTTGEGGMVTTNDSGLADRVRLLRSHGQRQQYLHTMLGYNFRMTEIQAALGIAQLNKLDAMNQRRRDIAGFYREQLKFPAPVELASVDHVYHQYTLRVRGREKFLGHLESHGVGFGVHYPTPIHRQPIFQDMGYGKVSLPHADEASQQVVSIPVHPSLSDSDVERVADVVNTYA